MSKLLEQLLRPETPDVQKDLPQGRYELVRLSELYGEPVVLDLKGVPYGRALELKDMQDYEIQTVLAGDSSGTWKSTQLQERFGAATPAELVKKLLLPGEIRSVAVAVEQLSGYRKAVLLPYAPKGDEEPVNVKRAVREEIEKN